MASYTSRLGLRETAHAIHSAFCFLNMTGCIESNPDQRAYHVLVDVKGQDRPATILCVANEDDPSVTDVRSDASVDHVCDVLVRNEMLAVEART